jgi:drug/metabolite transporter (DMT)-like permease
MAMASTIIIGAQSQPTALSSPGLHEPLIVRKPQPSPGWQQQGRPCEAHHQTTLGSSSVQEQQQQLPQSPISHHGCAALPIPGAQHGAIALRVQKSTLLAAVVPALCLLAWSVVAAQRGSNSREAEIAAGVFMLSLGLVLVVLATCKTASCVESADTACSPLHDGVLSKLQTCGGAGADAAGIAASSSSARCPCPGTAHSWGALGIPANVRMTLCTVGIIVSFLLYGYVLERTTSDGRRLPEVIAIMANSLVYVVVSYLALKLQGQPEPLRGPAASRWRKFVLIALSAKLATFLTWRALRYVSFPTQVLAKSCKALPIVLINRCAGKRHSWTQYSSVLLITAGVVMFSWISEHTTAATAATAADAAVAGGHSHPNGQRAAHTDFQGGAAAADGIISHSPQSLLGLGLVPQASSLGWILLLLALAFDGVTGHLEDAVIKDMEWRHGQGTFELMLHINFFVRRIFALCVCPLLYNPGPRFRRSETRRRRSYPSATDVACQLYAPGDSNLRPVHLDCWRGQLPLQPLTGRHECHCVALFCRCLGPDVHILHHRKLRCTDVSHLAIRAVPPSWRAHSLIADESAAGVPSSLPCGRCCRSRYLR